MQWLRALTLTADGAVFELRAPCCCTRWRAREKSRVRGRTTGRILPRGVVVLVSWRAQAAAAGVAFEHTASPPGEDVCMCLGGGRMHLLPAVSSHSRAGRSQAANNLGVNPCLWCALPKCTSVWNAKPKAATRTAVAALQPPNAAPAPPAPLPSHHLHPPPPLSPRPRFR